MLDVTTAAWAVTVGVVLVLLAIDLALAVARPVSYTHLTLPTTPYV